VVDDDGGRAAGGAGVVVADGGGDGVRVRGGAVARRGAVIRVRVGGAEGRHAGDQVERRVGRAVAPGDHHRLVVLTAGVGDRPAQGCRVARVPRRQLCRYATVGGSVVDDDGGRAADAAGVVVGHRRGDGDRVRRRAVAGGQAVVLVDVAGAEAG